MSKIKSLKAREILDSRGAPTVEVDLVTDKGLFRSSVPSGASKGKHEAVALKAKVAVRNVNGKIQLKLKGKDPTKQKEIDDLMRKLDGTENKSKLGANAIVGVSMAVCRAGAAAQNLPLWKYISQWNENGSRPNLPQPSFNIINGGAHAGNELDFQEFMIVPQIKPFSKGLEAASEIYHTLKGVLKENFGKSATNIGDEGGFAPPIRSPEEALSLIQGAVGKSGYKDKIKNILDVAASQFYINGRYKTKMGVFASEGLLDYYQNLIKKYPIIALEDPFAEEDWEGFQEITKELGKKVTVIGDDLLVTNPKRIKEAHKKKACNGLLLKVNQIGTVTEAIEAAKLARAFHWKVMVSHRSGETCDDFIADLSVGIGADYIKAGAPARGERLVKYNRLLRIEEEI